MQLRCSVNLRYILLRAATTAPTDRAYLLERVGEAAVVQVYADGFRDLPLREKTLVWHLTQAAIAGRDIFYDQRYAHNLEMRDVLEAIVTHPAGVDPTTLDEIAALHQAVLDQHRSVQQPHRAQVRAAVHAARHSPRPRTPPRAPARAFPLANGETLDQLLGAAAADVLRSRRRPDGHQQDAAGGQGHPHRQRQQPLRRRDDGGSRRASRSSIRSTRGW